MAACSLTTSPISVYSTQQRSTYSERRFQERPITVTVVSAVSTRGKYGTTPEIYILRGNAKGAHDRWPNILVLAYGLWKIGIRNEYYAMTHDNTLYYIRHSQTHRPHPSIPKNQEKYESNPTRLPPPISSATGQKKTAMCDVAVGWDSEGGAYTSTEDMWRKEAGQGEEFDAEKRGLWYQKGVEYWQVPANRYHNRGV